MAEKKIPNHTQIDDVPEFMQAVKDTYGVDIPINLASDHPLSNLWSKAITVVAGTSPNPIYTATGSITDEFPFNFAKDANPSLAMNLKIDVFQPPPQMQSRRGLKVTVFHVPDSTDVIVRDDKDVPSQVTG